MASSAPTYRVNAATAKEPTMPKLRVHAMSMSLDGFVAGPDQTLDDPLGVGGPRLHEWILETRTGRAMMGEGGGTTGVDDASGFASGVVSGRACASVLSPGIGEAVRAVDGVRGEDFPPDWAVLDLLARRCGSVLARAGVSGASFGGAALFRPLFRGTLFWSALFWSAFLLTPFLRALFGAPLLCAPCCRAPLRPASASRPAAM